MAGYGNTGLAGATPYAQPTPAAPPPRGAANAAQGKAVFFDMVHSNNAARIRLWIRCKGLDDVIEQKVLTYPDLQTEEFKKVNPLKKMPAFIAATGECFFESYVILEYLEDKFKGEGKIPSFALDTAEKRAHVQLLIRIHDVYISSPNCSQPGFSHSQGSMYLSPYETKWCAASRCMDKKTRAAKLAELWLHLNWLEGNCKGPYLAGPELTLADMTWYPTTIFMEFMLPRVFQWPNPFGDSTVFPRLTAWHQKLTADPIFAAVRKEIWDFWLGKETEGQFESIKGELTDTDYKWTYAQKDVKISELVTTTPPAKPIFFDMVHSNNGARVRLWIRSKGMEDVIETKILTYKDIQTPEFVAVNPLKKIPGLVTDKGDCLFESHVILRYLEDRYEGVTHGGRVAHFQLATPEMRSYVDLLVRIHDIYIASPNCTQPGFSHSQGSMYLSPYETKWCAAVRCMDRPTRAAKLAEIWQQLQWLEGHCKGPYLAGAELTIADMTWYPTTIFMEFMLPRVFEWPHIFNDTAVFPSLTAWHQKLTANKIFAEVRQEIWDFWLVKETEGQFESIKGELTDTQFKWKYSKADRSSPY